MTSIFDIKRMIGGFGELADDGKLKPLPDSAVIDTTLRAVRSLFIAMRHAGDVEECATCSAILPQKPYKSVITVAGNRCCATCAVQIVNDDDYTFASVCSQIASHVAVTDACGMADCFRREWERERDTWISNNTISAYITLIKRGIKAANVPAELAQEMIDRPDHARLMSWGAIRPSL